MGDKDIYQKKQEALNLFIKRLFENGVKDKIARIILFGSVAEEKATEDSDIDILIAVTGSPEEVSRACDEVASEVGLVTGESVEPLIHFAEELRVVSSYFIYQVLKYGKEVYTMDEKRLRKEEALAYLDLANEYLDGAKKCLEIDKYRNAVDSAHNACELVAKAFLLKKIEKLPTSHGGVINRLGELYIKSGELPEDLTRKLRRSLRNRNRARYEPHAVITREMAEEIISLGKELVKLLERRI
ncbi:MAG: hypothetical protein COT45_06255 [bacterium (Candidatus Stahlbacteria) CG08_land_8_20_14_0_20_40_26]|nr:MAG: hypothetical protein COT45_06255 [bacterium (Candidatus Stahlbacteria) CG08_land_8_20_14_0_20_40_26]